MTSSILKDVTVQTPFPAQNIDKVVDLCHTYSNEETTYHALWLNQCIELWFLLHFSFIHSDSSSGILGKAKLMPG